MLATAIRLMGRQKLVKACQCVTFRHGTSIPVILVSDFEQKGSKGEEIIVKRGYARNFLIPRKIAVYATSQNKAKFRTSLAPTCEIIDNTSALKAIGTITIVKAASETGSLYGGLSATDITDILSTQHKLLVSSVTFPQPIKSVGKYVVQIDGVDFNIQVKSN